MTDVWTSKEIVVGDDQAYRYKIHSGEAQTKKEVKKIVNDHFDDCGGLIMVIDSETGEEANV